MIRRLTFILMLLISTPVFASETNDLQALLSAWQIPEAKKALDLLKGQYPDEPDVMFLDAQYDFMTGDYANALKKIDQAITQKSVGYWKLEREVIAATLEVTKDYEKHTSPSGRFEIYITPGKDRVLIPYAFEALESAYTAFEEEIGFKPPTPIRIEVYPTTATLAKVSTLTEENIRNSGTIALCKYNRLMITSPKALLRGYGWVDTLIHEYVHYVINQKTKNQVPIWMHEGLAKFLERRWRGPNSHRMSPEVERLLQKRVKANDLITFEQMHPSMAKLPTQEDAAVAFAEVYTAMEYLREKAGPTAFRDMLDRIANGEDARKAFALTLGKSFPEFEKDWKKALKNRPPVEQDSKTFQEKLVFKDDAGKGNELETIREPQAKDYFHLGQMLQSRERFGAAVIEYNKAIRLMGTKNPFVQSRLAQSLLALGKYDETVEALKPVTERHPNYVASWIALGHGYLKKGAYPEAKIALLEAARLNPFDPEVHEHLAVVFDKLGDQKRAQQEREFLRLLQ